MKLVILRGCPAVGKSVLAKELTQKIKGKIAKLTLDEFQWDMTAHKKRTKKDFSISFNNYLYVLENYLKNDYNVITEDIWIKYYEDKSTDIEKVIQLGKKYKTKIYLILLKAKWETIKSRNSIRHRIVPIKELKDIYNRIYSKNLDNEFAINIDGKSSKRIVNETLKFIK